MKAPRTRLPAEWIALILGLCGVSALLALRLSAHPMEAYGDSAAQYIEPLARLRLLTRLRAGLPPNPLRALVALDGLYPPGLPLVECAFGALFGHSAERVAWLGPAWWLLQGGALGVLGAVLGRRAGIVGAGPAVALAALLLPAAHGAALRSYPDLPMGALLWLSLAALARASASERRGPLWGSFAGIALLAAVLVKWTALPFGAVMLVGGLSCLGPGARRPAGVAAALALVGAGAFVAAGAESLGAMGGATFQPPPGTNAQRLFSDWPAPLGPWLGASWAQLAATDLDRLRFYPERLLRCLLSPAGAMVLLLALPAWAARRAPGLSLVLVVILGQLAFLLLLVPPLDDRFLLCLAPALALPLGLGLAGGGAWRRGLGLLGLLVGLGVAADQHLPPPIDPFPTMDPGQRDARLEGRAPVARLGLSSSIDRRGWSRSADLVSDRTALREALWARLVACGGGLVGGRDRALSAAGDLNWWTYRRLLATLEAGPARRLPRWAAEPGAQRGAPALWVGAGAPQGWRLQAEIADPEGGPGLVIWTPPDGPPCDL